jgi:hypothetical protein
MRAALIAQDGLVVNVIVLEENVEYVPPEGLALVFDPTGGAEPGGSWDGNTFYPAPSPRSASADADVGETEVRK